MSETSVVSGKVDEYHGGKQMAHPDYVGTLAQKAELAAVEPVYRLTEGLTPRIMRKAVTASVAQAPAGDERLTRWRSGDCARRTHRVRRIRTSQTRIAPTRRARPSRSASSTITPAPSRRPDRSTAGAAPR